MHFLVTAGNTQTPIDRVRCITNVFTGRTGASIAAEAHQRGHTVTLLTSHLEAVKEWLPTSPTEGWTSHTYRTFDELSSHLERFVKQGAFQALVHSAAVSDYRSAGIFAPAPGTYFKADGQWVNEASSSPTLLDRSAGKVKSDEPELWLRLVRTPKLIDRFRSDWGYQGILVKFKLEVGLDDTRLVEAAERSRVHSSADLMVANTLEGSRHWALVGPIKGSYERVGRRELASRLLDEVEELFRNRGHG